jgi:spoIIIJ-associated protein
MTYEFEGKTEKDAIEKAVSELNLNADQFDVEILEAQKKTLFKSGHVKIRVIVEDEVSEPAEHVEKSAGQASGKLIPQDEFEQKLVDFIKSVIEKMGYSASVDVFFREEKKIGIRLDSDSSSILIGRKGKNLDALQLLANVYAGHLGREDVRVILDTENYRVRREENLVHLAYTTADKVRSTRLSVLLEPMNPYDRRIIHTTLNDISDIETKSEGEGLFKQVRIMLKSF